MTTRKPRPPRVVWVVFCGSQGFTWVERSEDDALIAATGCDTVHRYVLAPKPARNTRRTKR